jgi:hypothetical protein
MAGLCLVYRETGLALVWSGLGLGWTVSGPFCA